MSGLDEQRSGLNIGLVRGCVFEYLDKINEIKGCAVHCSELHHAPLFKVRNNAETMLEHLIYSVWFR